MAARFKCDLDCPTIKTALEALDACNFISAYHEIGKMVPHRMLSSVVSGMEISGDPVMDIKLRACKSVLSLAGQKKEEMEYAVKKNLDFACCSRSSYGDCLISLLANLQSVSFGQDDGTKQTVSGNAVLERAMELSKAIYRTDYDGERMEKEFSETMSFSGNCMDSVFLETVQKDAEILENEWI